MSKNKLFKVTLTFDNEDAAKNWFANWLDGGGDGGGNLDWDNASWDDKSIRIKGTGLSISEDGEIEDDAYYARKEAELIAKFDKPAPQKKAKKKAKKK